MMTAKEFFGEVSEDDDDEAKKTEIKETEKLIDKIASFSSASNNLSY